ncbi:MAG: hypothetical protein PW843_28560 [Azospirillaceae bacterium]|nr:hypothetical protein [Azospirillaceae bacterium]
MYKLHRKNVRDLCMAACVLAAAEPFALARAQTQNPAQPADQGPAVPGKSATAELDEVIVTAQKRVENSQTVPVAVTSVTGDTMAQRGNSDVTGPAGPGAQP